MEETFSKPSPENKHRILVLDCDHKNALAIIRHLGKTRLYIIDAVSYGKSSVAFYSKYVNRKFIISNPKQQADKYINELLKILQDQIYLVLIPVSYISYQLCSVNKGRISQFTHLTIADQEHIYLAASKIRTYELAGKAGVPYPAIVKINFPEEIEQVQTTYPCVIKGPFETGRNIVEYANDRADMISKYREMCTVNNFKEQLPFIQQYIHGEGAGFFALYKNGECINFFMHRRIREYPVRGGASTVAESFYSEEIKNQGMRILNFLKWNGVAMVEFKKDDRTGIFNLMEINAKFWGSLDLALECGVNFPQMLIDDALGKEIQVVEKYKYKKFQWILNGDLFHLIERPWKIFSFVACLFTAKNDVWFTDIKPNLFQLMNIPVHYYKKWRK